MSINTTEGNQCYSHETDGSVGQIVTSFVESTDAPESAAEPFVELVEGLAHQLTQAEQDAAQARERAHEAESKVADLEQKLADERETRARESAEDRKRISDLEDRADEQDPASSKQGVTEPEPASRTPIERLSQAEDVSEVTDSISVERAVDLFKNVTDWGRRTPKGYTLRPKDRPKELLESARDESLNWKQYYRSAEALERLSEGAVTFVKTERHGKTLVFHEKSDAFERRAQQLSVTTAGATT